MKKLSDIGEIKMLERLCRALPVSRDVIVGAGDDCAVIGLASFNKAPSRGRCRGGWDLLFTSDPVIEGVHFKSDASSSAVGHKALGRALSDIAAMGGEPLWALIDIVAPDNTSAIRLSGIYAGLKKIAVKYGVSIVGGDIAHGALLELHVFCAGRVPRGKAVLRSGAKPGDMLFVTGSLGGSASGRHLRFEPRLREGRWLAENGWASSMIDLSDGMASDARRLAVKSGVGVELLFDAVPVSKILLRRMTREKAVSHALSDGEDYELLFTVPKRKAKAFLRAWNEVFKLSCVCVGGITDRVGLVECVDSGKRFSLMDKGYEHFV